MKRQYIFILVLLAAFSPACQYVSDLNKRIESAQTKNEAPLLPAEEAKKLYLAPGNPSNAGTDPNNYLLINSAFAASYNSPKGHANWVAWRLTKNDLGETPRQNDFRPDPALPGSFPDITSADYSSSGYERGHLCPSADRASLPALNSLTFLMTNITPQTHGLNSGPWEKLERYARSMARRNANLYIVAGGYGSKGKLRGKVNIPARFWKVIVVVENGGDISAVNESTRVIAVDMPNDDDILDRNWREFTVKVKNIEEKTGFDLLSGLPRKIQDTLEAKVDPRSER